MKAKSLSKDSNLFEKLVKRVEHVISSNVGSKRYIIIAAFSGGKDSTLLLHLLAETLIRGKIRPPERLYILFNDTLAEIPHIHYWAQRLGEQYEKFFQDHGLEAEFVEVKPAVQDSFYWRSIIDGYPAPTFKFRWCVTLLKINPLKQELNIIRGKHPNATILLFNGARRDESPARAKSLSSRLRCMNSGSPSCLGVYILEHDFGSRIVRLAPLGELSENDVWSILHQLASPPFDSSDLSYDYLFTLYFSGVGPACTRIRFGCWFCTVTSKHCGLRSSIEASDKLGKYVGLSRKAMVALWLLRLLYRRLSDLKIMRERKERGYSKLGPLKPLARAILLQALRSVYQAYGSDLLYGLEQEVAKGISLALLLFKLDAEYARDLVTQLDSSRRAFADFEMMRDEDLVRRKLQQLQSESKEVAAISDLYETIVSRAF